MEIVVATKEQLPIIQQLAHDIWPETYGGIISEGQIAYMLDMMYSIPALERQLESNKIFILFQEEGNNLGFASYELNAEGSPKAKIHKLYVLPQTQGKGIGKQLLGYMAEKARENQNTALYLTVNKNNKARDFYERMGFEVTREAIFDIGQGYVMDDYIMEKPL